MSGEAAFAPVEAVFFDKDGTLFDFHATWGAWTAEFLRSISDGDPVTYEVLCHSGGYDPADRRFAKNSVLISGTPRDVVEALFPHVSDRWSVSELLEHLDSSSSQIRQVEAAELEPLLDGLRASGFRLGVVTNDAELPARAHLASVGIEASFDFVFGYDSGHGAKPAPGQLLAGCEKLELSARQVAMVGDSSHDLLAARAAGCHAIGVLTGLASQADLQPLSDAVIPHIGYLPKLLGP